MCGIIGYAGERDTAEVLLNGLKKLEYRGYDSAGIALADPKKIDIYKKQGKVAALEENIPPSAQKIFAGIGHTRWATHGAPEDRNAHPHRCGRVVLVHNGIIENEQELRAELAKKGLTPTSDTDTELIAMLLAQFYEKEPRTAIRKTCALLEGSYALGILFEDQPGKIYAIRRNSPLIIGKGEQENFIASDIPAILKYTRSYYLPEEGELAEITKDEILFFDAADQPIEKTLATADWDEQAARKAGYDHFMAKEIAEQPEVVQETIRRYLKNGVLFEELGNSFKVTGMLRIVACGSAYHAGLLGKQIIEKLARIPVEVSLASEFRYADPLLTKEDLVVAISQSGETADTLAALRLAKAKEVPTLGIVNVRGSSVAREADQVLYTAAGPEISVATTKAYTCQVVMLYLLALRLAQRWLDGADLENYVNQVEALPALLEKTLSCEAQCKEIAKDFASAEHLFFIGRGQDYAVCCEGSLKLKEISYIHSEAYAAGELKHGTISLIEEGTPVIAIATDRARLPKIAANIREVRARGARVLGIGYPTEDGKTISLPQCPDFTAPIAAAVVCQMLAYHVAVARGNDVDQPRNLAKSVTVE